MTRIEKARQIVAEWNAAHTDSAFIPWETVEEALISFDCWRVAVHDHWPPEVVERYLDRHNTFCGRIPDALLLALFEEEITCATD